MLLPSPLLLLVSNVLGQQTTQLVLNQIIDGNVNASSPPTVFSIPSSSSALNISISLCTNQLPYPQFILTNDTSRGIPKVGASGNSTFNVSLDDGLGILEGLFLSGGLLAVYPGDTSSGTSYSPWSFQVAVSDYSKSPSMSVFCLLIPCRPNTWHSGFVTTARRHNLFTSASILGGI